MKASAGLGDRSTRIDYARQRAPRRRTSEGRRAGRGDLTVQRGGVPPAVGRFGTPRVTGTWSLHPCGKCGKCGHDFHTVARFHRFHTIHRHTGRLQCVFRPAGSRRPGRRIHHPSELRHQGCSMTPARLIKTGSCCAACLVAATDESRCSCACDGRHHGMLAQVDVTHADRCPTRRLSPDVRRRDRRCRMSFNVSIPTAAIPAWISLQDVLRDTERRVPCIGVEPRSVDVGEPAGSRRSRRGVPPLPRHSQPAAHTPPQRARTTTFGPASTGPVNPEGSIMRKAQIGTQPNRYQFMHRTAPKSGSCFQPEILPGLARIGRCVNCHCVVVDRSNQWQRSRYEIRCRVNRVMARIRSPLPDWAGGGRVVRHRPHTPVRVRFVEWAPMPWRCELCGQHKEPHLLARTRGEGRRPRHVHPTARKETP